MILLIGWYGMRFLRNFNLQGRALQYTATVTCLLATLCCGFHLGWSSPYLPDLISEASPIPMTNDEACWVAIMFLLAGPGGSISTAIMMNFYGRKTMILASNVPLLISWLMLAFATTFEELLGARFIAGFAEGCVFVATPIYLGEICDPEIRGFVGCCVTITYCVGVLLMGILGSYLSVQKSALLCATLPIMCLFSFTCMPESPNYLLLRTKKEEARRNLVALKGVQDVNHRLEEIVSVVDKDRSRFTSLFNETNRRSLLVVMAIRFAQQFSGIGALILYAKMIFMEEGDYISPLVSVSILYVLQIVFSTMSSMLVDKIGRRPLLIISTIGSSIALLTAGSFFLARDVFELNTMNIYWVPTVVLIMYIVSYSLGLQSIPLFMVAEYFPTECKAYGVAISDVYCSLFMGIVSKYFQVTKDMYGMAVPFFTFAICCAAGLIIIINFVPETKNKTLEEIQFVLKNKK